MELGIVVLSAYNNYLFQMSSEQKMTLVWNK